MSTVAIAASAAASGSHARLGGSATAARLVPARERSRTSFTPRRVGGRGPFPGRGRRAVFVGQAGLGAADLTAVPSGLRGAGGPVRRSRRPPETHTSGWTSTAVTTPTARPCATSPSSTWRQPGVAVQGQAPGVAEQSTPPGTARAHRAELVELAAHARPRHGLWHEVLVWMSYRSGRPDNREPVPGAGCIV